MENKNTSADVEVNQESPKEDLRQRREERYAANAAAVLDGSSQLTLKDVSLTGGRIASEEFIDVIPNGKYTIAIVPEEESKLGKFEVDIVSRWMKMSKNRMDSGFIMVMPPGSKALEDYIEYLKSKPAH